MLTRPAAQRWIDRRARAGKVGSLSIMKTPRSLFALLFSWVALATTGLAASSAADAGPVYELRTYTAPAGKREALLARFRDHTVKLFEKHGMKNVGYWVPVDGKDGGDDKLIYLLEHKSRAAAEASWKSFLADPVWKDVNAKTTANGPIVAKIDAVFLKPTGYGKAMTAGKKAGGPERVFELRTYHTLEGRLGNLDARFRDHTVKLFEKHGMTNLGYFHPMDADKGAGKTLVYFLAHPSREAAAAGFKAFGADEAWKKARADSEKDGKINSKVESVFLKPVDFSAIK